MMNTTNTSRLSLAKPSGVLPSRPQQRSPSVVVSSQPPSQETSSPQLNRRNLLFSVSTSLLAFESFTNSPQAAFAAEETTAPTTAAYVDSKDGFSISVPPGWVQGTGSLTAPPAADARSRFSNAGDLTRVVAWYPEGHPEVSIAITVKTPAADFTSLGSFGTAEQFGQNIVNQMDRSFLLRGPASERKNVTIAKLIDAKESGGRFLIQYTVSEDEKPERTVFSVVAMGETPKGLRRLYTVNGSCTSSELNEFGTTLQQAVATFAG